MFAVDAKFGIGDGSAYCGGDFASSGTDGGADGFGDIGGSSEAGGDGGGD